MKTLIALLLLLPFAVVADETNTTNTTKPKGPSPAQLEIIKVFREHFTAKVLNARVTVDFGQVVSIQPHWPQYTAALHKIDADKCPKKFNLAWFDYKAAVDKAGRPFVGLGPNILKSGHPLIELGATVLLGRVAENEEIAEAWTKLERAALECGVDSEKIKY